MKKFICILCVLALLCGITGCKKKEDAPAASTAPATTAPATTAPKENNTPTEPEDTTPQLPPEELSDQDSLIMNKNNLEKASGFVITATSTVGQAAENITIQVKKNDLGGYDALHTIVDGAGNETGVYYGGKSACYNELEGCSFEDSDAPFTLDQVLEPFLSEIGFHKNLVSNFFSLSPAKIENEDGSVTYSLQADAQNTLFDAKGALSFTVNAQGYLCKAELSFYSLAVEGGNPHQFHCVLNIGQIGQVSQITPPAWASTDEI